YAMAERITLEVPATLSALSTVRLVLGGLATRLDFPYEHLDDLSLATDNLLRAALDSEDLEDLRIAFHADGGTLRVACGLFRSASLRERVGVTPGNCIDLCLVLRR